MVPAELDRFTVPVISMIVNGGQFTRIRTGNRVQQETTMRLFRRPTLQTERPAGNIQRLILFTADVLRRCADGFTITMKRERGAAAIRTIDADDDGATCVPSGDQSRWDEQEPDEPELGFDESFAFYKRGTCSGKKVTCN